MAFQVRAKDGGKLWAHATLRDGAGRVTQYGPDQVAFAPQAHWTSPRTGASYPVATTITTGTLRWQLKPLQPDQELDSRRSTGAVYWEGAVTAEGSDPKGGGRRLGRGYLELTGYLETMKL
jgi:predicted secreted hydrolase